MKRPPTHAGAPVASFSTTPFLAYLLSLSHLLASFGSLHRLPSLRFALHARFFPCLPMVCLSASRALLLARRFACLPALPARPPGRLRVDDRARPAALLLAQHRLQKVPLPRGHAPGPRRVDRTAAPSRYGMLRCGYACMRMNMHASMRMPIHGSYFFVRVVGENVCVLT